MNVRGGSEAILAVPYGHSVIKKGLFIQPLYGQLFLPRPTWAFVRNEGLTVMTFNSMLGNPQPAGVVAAIRASGADVVAIQELSRPVATVIERDLASEYPYQELAPQHDDTGMGVISRYPPQVLK